MNFCPVCGCKYKLVSAYCGSCGASGITGVKPGPVRGAPTPAARHLLQRLTANGNVGQCLVIAAALTVAYLTAPGGVLTLVAAAWIYGFVQGFRNRVVLFYDTKDALVAFGCISACFVAVWWAPMWLVAAAMGLWTARNAVYFNRNLLVGATVTIFKLTFGLAWIADLFNELGVAADSKRKNIDRVWGLGLAVLLVWLMTRLINGKEVYKARGWSAP